MKTLSKELTEYQLREDYGFGGHIRRRSEIFAWARLRSHVYACLRGCWHRIEGL